MAQAYHRDLRERAVGMMRDGTPKEEVAKALNIGRTTAFTWYSIWLDEERVEGKTGYQKGHSHKVDNLQEFQEFIEKNPNKTLAELGQLWKNPCKKSMMGRLMQRIGYTYKKRDALH